MASSLEILPVSENNVSALLTGPHAHQVQFYETDGFLIRSVANFVNASLKAGGSAILLATEAHRGPILEQLDRNGVPSHAMLNRCVAVDASETLSKFMVEGFPDREKFFTVVGELLDEAANSARNPLTPVSAFGEMVAILWAEGKREAAVQLEQLWNDLGHAHSFSLLCAYPLREFSREEHRHLFAKICTEHSSVVPSEGFTVLTGEDEKSRKIAELQQRAEALESEILARAMAEEKLKRSYAELESTVEQRTEALRRLSLHLLNVQDAERRRIARELHDSLGQDFVGLRMNLDLARRSPHRGELWEQCDRVLDHCISEVRTLSYLLHPPMIEEVGFLSAAEWYVQDFTRRSGTQVNFEVAENVGAVPNAAKLVLFRVLQECLINMHRHAHATAGWVRVMRDGESITLEVRDNGVGIPADKLARFNQSGAGMGVGLTGIWERVRDLGGRAELISAKNGTLIRISVPFTKRRRKNP
jgi:signal transduction histidine kinase